MNADKLLERFLTYVKIDTQSDPNSDTTPSTKKQWNLAKLLVEELKSIGLSDVSIDDNAYVTASLNSNIDKEVPTIGFVAHFDTTPDFTGTNVNPIITKNYKGGDIVLNEQENIVLSPQDFKELTKYKGQTIISTDGSTLLGADDKAGITEIICAMEYLVQHPEIKHGKIRVCFTPDEEIGRGAHHFDVKAFGAKWAYTMDGSEIGELEYENFNAAEAIVEIKGKIVHPGYAKNKMVNSMYIAQEFIDALPRLETPEHTSGYEGFFHLYSINGEVDHTTLRYIIRDHDKKHFEARKEMIQNLANEMNQQRGDERISVQIKDQYYNMREKVEPMMHIIEIAAKAMENIGITPKIKPIRGGTDGAQLSYMGLPCPNIFAGGHNFHGRYEFVPLESMVKASEVIVEICKLTAQDAN